MYVAVLVLDEAQVVVVGLVTAGSAAVVDGDMAVAFGGSGCGTGFNGASWGEQGGVGQSIARRLGFWGRQSRSVECPTRSDEHARTTSCNGISWAVNSVGASFTACWGVPAVVVVVRVLDAAVVVVFGPVAAGFAAIVGCDAAAATGGSGRKWRGWGLSRSAVGGAGSECHHVRHAGGCFEAGGKMVVVAVNNVDSADGGCAGVVHGDVADSGGDGVAVGLSLGAVCIAASAVQVEVVWEAVSTMVGLRPVVRASHSAILPRSSPSFRPFSNCAVPATFNALINPSFTFANPSLRPSFIISS